MKIRSIAPRLLMAFLACGGVVAGCNNSGDADNATPPPVPKGQPLPPGNNLADPSKPAAGYTGPATGRGSDAGAANSGK